MKPRPKKREDIEDKRDEFVREGGETCEQAGSGLPKTLYGNPKWHELSELVVIQRLQGQTSLPAKRRSENKKQKNKKNTVYILATHGPLSQSCSKNWLHTLPAYSAKPTPSRVVFLSASPGTPPLWPSIRKVLRWPPLL